jgi:outer membrane lipoprotein-sorting protein
MGTMNRRTFALTAAALALLPLPARAEPVPLAALSRYINAIETAETRFTQINDDGTKAGGTLYIRRPGRMRFEYDPPERTLVLANAGQVAVFDGKSNQPPEEFPLRRTPLNLILGERVDLSEARMVVDHFEDGGATVVVAQDPKNPEYGTIALYFTPEPLALSRWIVTDEAGAQTITVLEGLLSGKSYPGSLFSISAEVNRRGG